VDPRLTFFAGLTILILFGWYFATDIGRRKRILGSALTVLLIAFSLVSMSPPADKIKLGMDLKGGTSFLIRLMPGDDGKALTPEVVDQAVEVIRKRVDSLGVSEPVITPQGADRILVQIPGLDTDSIENARQQLQQVARLTFHLVDPASASKLQQIDAGTAIIEPGWQIAYGPETGKGKPRARYLIKTKPDLLGDRVTRAGAFYGAEGWGVNLVFDNEGAQKFGELTEQVYRERSQLAIVLDGVVVSAPGVTKGAIYGGQAQITGSFTEAEARNLASVLINPLSVPVAIEEERSASATLGQDSIRSGIYAGLAGLLLTLVFVVLYYRFSGVIAVLGLVVNIVLLFGIMAMFGLVLTLPGIAGIILTIGMAVDANVLIFERLREELASGKPLNASIEAAYEKAYSAIFDANATTLITAAILFWRASGPVKGFAVTLTIGIIASVFCAMIVTRNLFDWMLAAKTLKKVSMLNLISGRGYDFLSRRKLWVGVSILAIIGSFVVFGIRGEGNFGIDFRGGDLVMLKAQGKDVTTGQVRKTLADAGLSNDVTIQSETDLASGRELISLRSPQDTSDPIIARLTDSLPQADFKVLQQDKVGSLVGEELARNSLIALGVGIIGILIFVTIRVEFSFALGAIFALLHDVIITLGAFSLSGHELSLIMVGAVLTVAGYSINDTIVVFDRIREALRSATTGRRPVQQIMNDAINETLSRTLITSGTTLITLFTLYVFGGPVLKDFSFAIIVGIVAGTYSSIFVASPIVLWLSHRKGRTLHHEIQEADAAKVAGKA
jgi:SecD/SecF fusion protein